MADPLKVGLIGAGGISRQHLPGYQHDPERVRLEAVCDIREDRAREFAAEADLDADAVFRDAREMCELAEIDAVDICTIHDTHAELAIAAAQAGKHVLLEKPMAISIEECRAIVEATERAGVTLMVAQHLRHVPSYIALRRRIQAGELGRIWSARVDTFLTAALDDPNQPIAPGRGFWGFDGKRGGGGVVTLLSVHHLDLMRFFVGEVARVDARAWRGHPSFTNEAEDRAVATLEFANGAIGTLTASLTSRAPWLFQTVILGDEGAAWTPPPTENTPLMWHRVPAVLTSARQDGATQDGATQEGEERFDPTTSFQPLDTSDVTVPTDNPYINEIIHFASCCEDGAEPISGGRDNLETMKIVFAIYESAQSGRPVDLETL